MAVRMKIWATMEQGTGRNPKFFRNRKEAIKHAKSAADGTGETYIMSPVNLPALTTAEMCVALLNGESINWQLGRKQYYEPQTLKTAKKTPKKGGKTFTHGVFNL